MTTCTHIDMNEYNYEYVHAYVLVMTLEVTPLLSLKLSIIITA